MALDSGLPALLFDAPSDHKMLRHRSHPPYQMMNGSPFRSIWNEPLTRKQVLQFIAHVIKRTGACQSPRTSTFDSQNYLVRNLKRLCVRMEKSANSRQTQYLLISPPVTSDALKLPKLSIKKVFSKRTSSLPPRSRSRATPDGDVSRWDGRRDKVEPNAGHISFVPLLTGDGLETANERPMIESDPEMNKVANIKRPETSTIGSPIYPNYILLGRRRWMDRSWIWMELESTRFESDREFFKALQQSRLKKGCGITPIQLVHQSVREYLTNVVSINYVKVAIVSVTNHEQIRVVESPSLPPEEERGNYLPCGRDFTFLPPISPHSLAHYYNNPNCTTETRRLLDRIPKKLSSPIMPGRQSLSSERSVAWGIETYEELRTGPVICAAISTWVATSTLLVGLKFERNSLDSYIFALAEVAIILSTFALAGWIWKLLYDRRVKLARELRLLISRFTAKSTKSVSRSWICGACGNLVTGSTDEDVEHAGSIGLNSIQAQVPVTWGPTEPIYYSGDQHGFKGGTLSLPPPATHSASGRQGLGTKGGDRTAQGINMARVTNTVQQRPRIKPPKACARFLICANTGSDNLPRFHEKLISRTLNDEKFFEYLKSLKRSKKSLFKPSKWFTGVVAINYVAIEVLDDGHVSLLERPGYAPLHVQKTTTLAKNARTSTASRL
ncbi:uncharacterized protein KY384_008756 [Bacidia gigantensis]|uniref:uncharacterized protein n=1 Tax=Bacidia gigantensis TaxID=2732470 RepID=UPI001D03CB2F|nr:uncharacterized protein KY384_008756 [Bacidia gigantensis]KAG8526555.1 hypothetical protein KY384_008756 [Bacidia gigantensis]